MRSLKKYFPETDLYKYRVKIDYCGEIDIYWFHAYDCRNALERLQDVCYSYSDVEVLLETLECYNVFNHKWFPCILRED